MHRATPTLVVLLIGLLAGCSSQPAAPDASSQGAAKAGDAATATTYAPSAKPEALTLAEAQKMGYRVVNEDGQTLYCRETRKLGSHIQKERTCLTAEELREVRDSSQRGFENMKRAIPPPAGN